MGVGIEPALGADAGREMIPGHPVRDLGVAAERGHLGEERGPRADVGGPGEPLERRGRLLPQARAGEVHREGQGGGGTRIAGRIGEGGRGKRGGGGRRKGKLLEAGRRQERVPAAGDLGGGFQVQRRGAERVGRDARLPVERGRPPVPRFLGRDVPECGPGRALVPGAEERPGQEPPCVRGTPGSGALAQEAPKALHDLGVASGVAGKPGGQEGGVVGEVGLLLAREAGHGRTLPRHLPVEGDGLVDLTLPGGRPGEHEARRGGLAGAGESGHRGGDPGRLGGAAGLEIGQRAQDGGQRRVPDGGVDGVDLRDGSGGPGRGEEAARPFDAVGDGEGAGRGIEERTRRGLSLRLAGPFQGQRAKGGRGAGIAEGQPGASEDEPCAGVGTAARGGARGLGRLPRRQPGPGLCCGQSGAIGGIGSGDGERPGLGRRGGAPGGGQVRGPARPGGGEEVHGE